MLHVTGADGGFSIDGLLERAYRVQALAPDSLPERRAPSAAAGNTLTLNRMVGEGAHFGPRMPILDGRSAVISLDEDAATLVLERGEEEVARIPLHLAAGAPNVVRYCGFLSSVPERHRAIVPA